MQGHSLIKDNPRRAFGQLKRERPNELDISRRSPSVSAVRLTPSSPSTSSLDIKRPRITPLSNAPPRIPPRNPISLLDECLKCCEVGDRQTALFRLRDFSNDHISLLDIDNHLPAVSILVKIASQTRFIEASRAALRHVLTVLERTPHKTDIWKIVAEQMMDPAHGFYSRPSLITSNLAVFELAILNGLLSENEIKVGETLAQQGTHSPEQTRRVAAINFLIAKTVKADSRSSPAEYSYLEKVLCKMTGDRDARVRVAAIKGLSLMSKTDRFLSIDLYPVIKQLCEDTVEAVRVESLHILKGFADRHSEREVKGRNNVNLRLIDDAFAAICHAVNDLQVSVRTEAAVLLGTFGPVSDSFLEQTLDKKLLNAMRMSAKDKRNASRRPERLRKQKERHAASAGWSTGKKLGEDVPAERVDEELTSIIPTGACGAFVTALEDEFMVVRQAAVYSLGRLAADRPFLASAALEHLADMFNDEIEQVRLDAIRALTPLVVHGVLQMEQLDTIFTVLDDALPDSREALRVLLSKATMSSPECIRYAVKALHNCMHRFPVDRESIFLCLSCIGRRHATFVQPLVDDLLGLDRVFDITEPALENFSYLAKLILILNAASIHSPICSLLPPFAVRHYRYLRCSMPHLVPPVQTFSESGADYLSAVSESVEKEAKGHRTRAILEKLYERMVEAYGASYQQRSILQKLIINDMEALCEMDEQVSGVSQLLSDLLRIFSFCDFACQILQFGGDVLAASNVIEQGLSVIDRVESEFSFVDAAMLGIVAECRFRLRLFRLSIQLDLYPNSCVNAAEVICSEVEAVKAKLAFLGTQPTQSLLQIMSGLAERIEVAESKKFIGGRTLIALFENSRPSLPKKFPSLGQVSVKWAKIVEPYGSSDEALRFIAGLPMGISFNVLLHNFTEADLSKFRFKVEYPDQTNSIFRPRKTDYKQLPASKYRLLCKVLVEGGAWSEPAKIKIGCVIRIQSQATVQLKSEELSVPEGLDSDNAARYIPVLESPYSHKQAFVEIPIFPMHKSC